MGKLTMSITVYNSFEIVEGFYVQPGFFRFELNGIGYFSSGFQCGDELKAYYLSKDTNEYNPIWLDVEDSSLAELLLERAENESFGKFKQSLGLKFSFSDYRFLDDRRKQRNIYKSLKGKFGLTQKECAYIACEIIKMDVTPEFKEIKDPDEFAEAITLSDHGTYHSWAGSYGKEEEGTILVGDLEWGKCHSTCDRHDGNGDPHYEESYQRPNFDIAAKAVVYIHTHDWDSYNGNDQENESDNILIYNPDQEAIEKFKVSMEGISQL